MRSDSPTYRPHIDGLRAVAILSVLSYHAGASWLPGGFLGVDVFFVVSGFLITRILLKDFAASSFSLWEFYKRRILRIVPALAVVLVATTLAAMALLLPGELLDYSRSLINASLSISNIYFWHSIDYFGRAAWHMPLLHTWSLAIEEQFYLLYPVLLWLFHTVFRGRLRSPVLVLTLLSLAACWFMDQRWPTAAFYLLPARAWELGIGCVLATCRDSTASRAVSTACSVAGVVLLLVPMAQATAESVGSLWPKSLPTCLGTALLIGFAERTIVGRVLSWRPIVFIGLVSYSLYLWHWPVLVFARLHYGDRLPALVLMGAIRIGLCPFGCIVFWGGEAVSERAVPSAGRAAHRVRRNLLPCRVDGIRLCAEKKPQEREPGAR